jgi:predicted dehydrogenase
VSGTTTASVTQVKYGYEYERRLRVGLIGCGGHAYTGILPTFLYTAFDLVAACDLKEERARGVALQYHASAVYADYREMLARERLDAVFVIVDYPDGLPRYSEIAIAALEAGCHVWMEKPPGRSAAEVRRIIDARDRARRVCVVSMKKMFLPTVEKMKEISLRPEFGGVASAVATYPMHLPPLPERLGNPASVRNFLDHIWHPGAVLTYLCGPAESLIYEADDEVGGGAALIQFRNGATGVLYMAAGRPNGAGVEVERYELLGSGHKLVARNTDELVWYRPYERPNVRYPEVWNYIESDDSGALTWKPELSRSATYNNSMFLNGTGQNVVYFCECLLSGRAPEKGTLEDALELAKWFEAFMGKPGALVQF